MRQQVKNLSFLELTQDQSFGSFDINPQTAPELSPWTSFVALFCSLFQRPTSNAF